MKHLIDLEYGSLVLIPETALDKRLLFHLMNCSDLSQFTQYVELEQKSNPSPMTTDLGVNVKNIEMYPVSSEIESDHPFYNIGHVAHSAKLHDHQSDMDFPPDFEFKPLGELVIYDYMLEPEQVIDFRKGTGETFLPATSKGHYMKNRIASDREQEDRRQDSTGQEKLSSGLTGRQGYLLPHNRRKLYGGFGLKICKAVYPLPPFFFYSFFQKINVK